MEVEAHLQRGLPAFAIVGLADRACQEAKERVRSGIASAELEWPLRRITVNLAPAELRKEGSGFDLPIALAVLAASRQVPADALAGHAAVGELALDGRLRAVGGVLAAAEGARQAGLTRLLCAAGCAAEAALAGIEPVPLHHLAEAVAYLRGDWVPPPVEKMSLNGSHPEPAGPDLADVRGQERARRALELAATGGHNLLLGGPPGTGKTMLARRLPGILPRLPPDHALEITRIHSVAGLLPPERPLVSVPPFRAPHHTASVSAIVGGGPNPRPGEASLAHHGVLFLDELAEFPRNALEALRQPLEDGAISIARVGGRIVFPARFQLVATMNLCPCGARGDPAAECSCSAARLAAYRDKLSRALLDRFDLVVTVPRPRARELEAGPGEGVGGRARARGSGARAGVRGAAPPLEAGKRTADQGRRALAALRSRPRAGGSCRPDGGAARGSRRGGCRACRRGAFLPLADGAGNAMNELALAAFAAETGEHVVKEPRERRFERFRRGFDAGGYLESLATRGFRFVGRTDADYPPLLRELHDPPPGLFLRGAGEAELLRRSAVAIVGARACSSYGAQVARLLGRELASAGLVVLSGLARGVDAEAHRGALEAGGLTVAILGCGVDRDYPAAHAQLARRVCERGLVASEYAPGVEPAPWRFPARNRIVAGLAAATVIVEARERSGALITADFALETGREVFAVPGEITSSLSAGTNALLRLGATPLTSSGDVLEALGIVPVAAAPIQLGAHAAAVLAELAGEPAGADQLIRDTGLDASAVATALAELELAGAVAEAEGLYRGVRPPG